MATTIKMNLSVSSIEDAIKQIKQYKADLRKKVAKLQEMICDRLRSEAFSSFRSAVEDILPGSGSPITPDVTVSIEGNGSVMTVIARGEDAIWFEFGTGVYHNGSAGSSPHPKGAENGFLIGTYGKGLGKRNTWGYSNGENTVLTHGIEASQAMWKACETIRSEYTSMVRSVFK